MMEFGSEEEEADQSKELVFLFPLLSATTTHHFYVPLSGQYESQRVSTEVEEGEEEDEERGEDQLIQGEDAVAFEPSFYFFAIDDNFYSHSLFPFLLGSSPHICKGNLGSSSSVLFKELCSLSSYYLQDFKLPSMARFPQSPLFVSLDKPHYSFDDFASSIHIPFLTSFLRALSVEYDISYLKPSSNMFSQVICILHSRPREDRAPQSFILQLSFSIFPFLSKLSRYALAKASASVDTLNAFVDLDDAEFLKNGLFSDISPVESSTKEQDVLSTFRVKNTRRDRLPDHHDFYMRFELVSFEESFLPTTSFKKGVLDVTPSTMDLLSFVTERVRGVESLPLDGTVPSSLFVKPPTRLFLRHGKVLKASAHLDDMVEPNSLFPLMEEEEEEEEEEGRRRQRRKSKRSKGLQPFMPELPEEELGLQLAFHTFKPFYVPNASSFAIKKSVPSHLPNLTLLSSLSRTFPFPPNFLFLPFPGQETSATISGQLILYCPFTFTFEMVSTHKFSVSRDLFFSFNKLLRENVKLLLYLVASNHLLCLFLLSLLFSQT